MSSKVRFTLRYSEYGKQLRKSLQAEDGDLWNRSERSARSIVAVIGSGAVPLFRFSPEGLRSQFQETPAIVFTGSSMQAHRTSEVLFQHGKLEYPDRIQR